MFARQTRAFCAGVLIWGWLAASASGQPVVGPDANALFTAGQFADVIPAARAMGTADGDALAARAELVVAAYQTESRPQAEAIIDQALADARRALVRDPNHIEGLLQLAIATGYRAKLRQSPSLARTARRLTEQALRKAPNNAFAWAALGGWHGETIADLGAFVAGAALGARKAEAFKYYDGALARDPASPSFPTFYAFNLMRLNAKAYDGRIRQLLAVAAQLEPRDGFERLMRTMARDVLAALTAGQVAKAQALVVLYQPFGKILS